MRKNGKKTLLIAGIALALVAVAVIGLILLLPGSEESYRTIVAAEVSGTVLVSNDKKQDAAAYAGMALYDGDTIVVAEGAQLTIELDGDKYMIAEGGTTFRLEATGKAGSDKTVIHLESGAALTRIKNALNEDQSYVIKTPNSVISVRGTVWRTSYSENAEITLCEVFGGLVEMAAANGQSESLMIPGGSSASVTEGQGISGPEDLDYGRLPKWILKILESFLDDQEELDATREELEAYLHEHTYADSWSYDENEHWYAATCEHASQERKDVQAHSFDDGVVTTSATHLAEGVMTYSCLCGYTKTETIDKLAGHSWSSWTHDGQNAEQHYRQCACGEKEWEPHTFGGDWLIGQNGHYQLCTVCNQAKSAEVAHTGGTATCVDLAKCEICQTAYGQLSQEHNFDGEWLPGQNGHYQLCTVCNQAKSAEVAHTGGTATCVDLAKCEICQAAYGELSQGHNFDGEWLPCQNGHYQLCAVCNQAKSAEIAHTGGTSTCVELAKCEICGESYGELSQEHNFGGEWLIGQNGHYQLCTVCNQAKSAEVGHTGGTATCVDLAKCEVCGTVYGELSQEHTFDGEWLPGQNGHYQLCTVCNQAKSAEVAHTGGTATCVDLAKCEICGESYGELSQEHNFGGEWLPGQNGHYQLCAVCNQAKSAEESHTGGTATCAVLAKCEVCGTVYGELSQEHTFDGEWFNGQNGHYQICTICNQAKSAEVAHTGGMATCVDLAKCETCGESYGELSQEHNFGGEWLPGQNGHYQLCAVCNQAKSAEQSHTGGTATCVELAKCETCGESYGELSQNHTFGGDWLIGKTGHYQICAVCNQAASAEKVHTGGTATCVELAQCIICGVEYGNLSTTHNYEGAYWIASQTGHYRICTVCKIVVSAEEPHIGTEATCAELAKCEICHAAYGQLSQEHIFGGEWLPGQNGHYQLCTVCSQAKSAEESHTGGTATCVDLAKCEICQAAYGELSQEHNFGGDWLPGQNGHYQLCTVCNQAKSAEVAHTGGTATCAVLAKCEVCGTAYGELSQNHTFGGEWLPGQTGHYQLCTVCSQAKSAEVAHTGGTATCAELAKCEICHAAYGQLSQEHDFGGDWLPGQNGHYQLCTVCNQAKSAEVAHTGGTATCAVLAKCEVCGTAYGELSQNHTFGGDWLIGQNGHYQLCTVCNQAKSAEVAHTGGTATCVDLAKCEVCDTAYGQLSQEHIFGGDWFNGQNGHYQICTVCNQAKSAEVAHTGGTSTCVELAKCETCGTAYGELSQNHIFGGEWLPSQNGHYQLCTVCNQAKSAEVAHTGGTATCVDIAKCEICGTAYGERSQKHIFGGEWLPGQNGHYQLCTVCNQAKSAEESHTGGTATCAVLAKCEICGAEYGQLSQEHIFGDGVPGTDPYGQAAMVYTCTVCGYREERGVCTDEHIYGAGVRGTASWGTEVMIYTCIYCDSQVTFDTLHDCYGDWDNPIYNGNYHWNPCTTAGCPARIDYGAHAYEEGYPLTEAPAYGQPGITVTGCSCGYWLPGTEVYVEFYNYFLDFSGCTTEGMNQYDNTIYVGDVFDYENIQFVGYYWDTILEFNDDDEIVGYDLGRVLNASEYTVRIYRIFNEYERIEIEDLDTTVPGEYEIHFELPDGYAYIVYLTIMARPTDGGT